MDPAETVVALSENPDIGREESKRSVLGDSFHPFNHYQNHDEYSDIYFDKSCANLDELSVWNFSNIPREIHLDQDNISENDIFLRPNMPDSNYHKHMTLSAVKGSVDGEDDQAGPPSLNCRNNLEGSGKFDMGAPSGWPIPTGSSRDEEQQKLRESFLSSSRNSQNYGETDQGQAKNPSSFTKNEGKLVFKITRYNRVTQKEKLITKNRRIISKCPHTSLKYYAKGMCK